MLRHLAGRAVVLLAPFSRSFQCCAEGESPGQATSRSFSQIPYRFMTVLIVGIGTVMLLVPMWILQALDKNNHKLGVITAFVVVFLGLVSYATVAKPFETLAATAA